LENRAERPAAAMTAAANSALGNQAIRAKPVVPISAAVESVRRGPGPTAWANDLSPIADSDWSFDRAGHLLERAGFGGTPEEIARLAAMPPARAVAALLDYEAIANDHLAPFDPSGVWDPSLRNFPLSRVAATELAEKTGAAMGVRVKPAGERRLQPVVDRFFYWLRATVPSPRHREFPRASR
jgi:hypothetical protein